MKSPNSSKKGILSGLARILHLHRLPDSEHSSNLPVETESLLPAKQAQPIIPIHQKQAVSNPSPAAKKPIMPRSSPTERKALYPRYPDIGMVKSPTAHQKMSSVTPKTVSEPVLPKVSRPASISPSEKTPPLVKETVPQSKAVATPLPTEPVSHSSPLPPKQPVPSASNTQVSVPESTNETPAVPISKLTPAPVAGNDTIVTDYDRILDLVKQKNSIRLDEIARLLALKEETAVRELQTLEDNGLIEIQYPAFGEPLILYKKTE